MADYSVVKGCMIIKPYGFAIWEKIRDELNKMIVDRGVQNCYFPMFIPESFLKKEAEHVEGFAPEVALVTHAGGKKLEEPLVVRPTSETMIHDTFSKWIQSYRDLPLRINQWANIVRWEMKTKPFLRTTEFLWQEGHTAHATAEEAKQEVSDALDMYGKLCEEYLAIPVLKGQKSESEKFAGADFTVAIETLAKDGKAIQAGTSHYLGQSFSKAFNILFQDKDGKEKHPHLTSWGVSTRMVGVLIVVHGDNDGLVLPPKMAPIQTVIVPIYKSEEDKQKVLNAVVEITQNFDNEGIRYKVDDRDSVSIGFKINDWEMKGVPLRLEIGPRDIENNAVMSARRDTKEKSSLKMETLTADVKSLLDDIQENLYTLAQKNLADNTWVVDNYDEFVPSIEEKKGLYRLHWCGDPKCEEKIKDDTKATSRLTSFDEPDEKGKCIVCGKDSEKRTYFAKSY